MSAHAVLGRVRELPEGGSVVVLAGPGVVADGRVEALRRLAARGGLGVVNTWGAKGVFEWQSPHHLGTAGLQERDFELGGLTGADLVVATGVDPDEAPPELWQVGAWTEVAPDELAELAGAWPRAAGEPDRPPLYTRLAEVIQPLFGSEEVPLAPPRAVSDLKRALPPGGRVVAEPGPAGFWVARAFPTTELGSVHVPARREPGGARAVAERWVAEGHPVVLVAFADDPSAVPPAPSRAPLVVDAWVRRGEPVPGEERAAALARALDGGRPARVTTPVDLSHTASLVDVAGPVIAWDGLLRGTDWRA